jgi:hypothetical protein
MALLLCQGTAGGVFLSRPVANLPQTDNKKQQLLSALGPWFVNKFHEALAAGGYGKIEGGKIKQQFQ